MAESVTDRADGRWRRLWLPVILWSLLGFATFVYWAVGARSGGRGPQGSSSMDYETAIALSHLRNFFWIQDMLLMLLLLAVAGMLHFAFRFYWAVLRGSNPVLIRCWLRLMVAAPVVFGTAIGFGLMLLQPGDQLLSVANLPLAFWVAAGVFALGMLGIWLHERWSGDSGRLDGIAYGLLTGASSRDFAPNLRRGELGLLLSGMGLRYGLKESLVFLMVGCIAMIWFVVARWQSDNEEGALILVGLFLVIAGSRFLLHRMLNRERMAVEQAPPRLGEAGLRRRAVMKLAGGGGVR